MKPYHYRFEKVLTFREQEKTETEVEFKDSVEAFETVATKLYDLLKKKEDILLRTTGEDEDRLFGQWNSSLCPVH